MNYVCVGQAQNTMEHRQCLHYPLSEPIILFGKCSEKPTPTPKPTTEFSLVIEGLLWGVFSSCVTCCGDKSDVQFIGMLVRGSLLIYQLNKEALPLHKAHTQNWTSSVSMVPPSVKQLQQLSQVKRDPWINFSFWEGVTHMSSSLSVPQ